LIVLGVLGTTVAVGVGVIPVVAVVVVPGVVVTVVVVVTLGVAITVTVIVGVGTAPSSRKSIDGFPHQ